MIIKSEFERKASDAKQVTDSSNYKISYGAGGG